MKMQVLMCCVTPVIKKAPSTSSFVSIIPSDYLIMVNNNVRTRTGVINLVPATMLCE